MKEFTTSEEMLWHGVTSCGDCPLMSERRERGEAPEECCHPEADGDVKPKPYAKAPPRNCPLRTTPLVLKIHGAT